MKYKTYILQSVVVVSMAITTSCISSNAAPKQQQTHQAVTIHDLPSELSFAGERVPLEWEYIREAIEREVLTSSCMHTSTTLALRRSTRYFPIIEPILKECGIPDDFKYLCIAESGLDINAVSPVKASGLWQFLPDTAKEKGLEVSDYVDERYHLEKSTYMACKYLNHAYEKFGSWTMAAASYNIGREGIARRIEAQGVDYYWDLFLPEETMRYVPRILGFKIITSDPKRYGFDLGKEDQLSPFKDFTIIKVNDSKIVWSEVASRYGATYRQLRILNPWIRGYEHNNPSRKSYEIKMPKKHFMK